MSAHIRNEGGGRPSEAEKISYNNSVSGLKALNVQNAIDELDEKNKYSKVKVDTGDWVKSSNYDGYMENMINISCLIENPIWSITGESDDKLPTDEETNACSSVPYLIASKENLTFLTKETTAPATFYANVQGAVGGE